MRRWRRRMRIHSVERMLKLRKLLLFRAVVLRRDLWLS
jgi:hypothetical protein